MYTIGSLEIINFCMFVKSICVCVSVCPCAHVHACMFLSVFACTHVCVCVIAKNYNHMHLVVCMLRAYIL